MSGLGRESSRQGEDQEDLPSRDVMILRDVLLISGLLTFCALFLLILTLVPWSIPPSTLPLSEIPAGVTVFLPFVFNVAKMVMFSLVALTSVLLSLLWWPRPNQTLRVIF